MSHLSDKFRDFWQIHWMWKVSVFVFVFLPMSIGYIMTYLIAKNVYDRTHPVGYEALGETTVESTSSILDWQAQPQVASIVTRIRDSLASKPSSNQIPLPPYQVRLEYDPDTNTGGVYLHCRLWCECRTDLPLGSFELLVFQLNLTALSYQLVADKVMRWEDYVQPFNLKLSIEEVNT